MNGTMRKHEKTAGYIVLVGGQPGSLCHGYGDARRFVLLNGLPATIFPSLRAAKRAVRDTKIEYADAQTQIIRAAFPEET